MSHCLRLEAKITTQGRDHETTVTAPDAGPLGFNGAACAGDHLWSQSLPDYSQGYDETRDPARDPPPLPPRPVPRARKSLLLVGGEWCSWCQEMNRFLDREPDLAGQLNRTFVVVKVNVSEQNKNESFLKAYPEVSGVPHFYVLDAKGRLLESFNTGLLEKGRVTTGRNSANLSPISSPGPPTADSPINQTGPRTVSDSAGP